MGIDMVFEYVGVVKCMLYNYFKFKDELVIVILQCCDQEFMVMLKVGVKKFEFR